jgi:hypothetical protein
VASDSQTTDLRQIIEALRTLNDGVLLRERERLWAAGNAEAASAVDDARHGISNTVRDLRRAEKEAASDAR